MGRLRSNSTAQPAATFLHLKFLEGRPPEFAARHPFAHELALAPDSIKLPEGLRTDVQREGIARYLQNNFKVSLRTLGGEEAELTFECRRALQFMATSTSGSKIRATSLSTPIGIARPEMGESAV